MDGFEKRKEQKKESIRRAALELFQSYGFRKVSVSEIARKAGVSQVTIYNHFGSKEALVRDVLQWYSLSILEKYEKTMTSEMPFLERLESIVFEKSEAIGQFQGELLQAWIHDDPDMQAFVEDIYTNRVIPIIKTFFEEGLRQGYIDQRFSLETIIFYFEIIRRGFFAMPELADKAEHDPALIKGLLELMTYGLNG
ncbi:MAG: TetR/AcrR family transcriptional regulator [Dehalococcoidales bacterium]|nr:TetR/AcrR family transcriptional regulator [Dehalococcoidales bacterium]